MADPESPRKLILLNGLWDVAPGAKEVPPGQWSARVAVPGLVDIASPGYDWQVHPYHWHRKLFTVDSSEEAARTILRIDQAMFGTEVWLNGTVVGSDIACYTSQEYDITRALLTGAENTLLLRVGSKATLPRESAVGQDQERSSFIPGVWGDVQLIRCGNPRIVRVQILPNIQTASAELRVTLENNSESPRSVRCSALIREWASGAAASKEYSEGDVIPPYGSTVIVLHIPISRMKLWSVEQPFLYESVIRVQTGEKRTDELRTRFGMRKFAIERSHFRLNGKRVFLKGGNIAFHRFLSDPDRQGLPWDLAWIKKVLIDIPRAHNFNFFRNHLGQMYNRWYDIADEHGMMIQNEWQFWTATGTKEQIRKEFTRWLQDNWNHPSIVIWDALNESSDDIVQNEVIPEMKSLDPTRPWEPVDFAEDHPYIYSLGPVLNDRKIGHGRAFQDIENSPTPSVVNELLWWWIDRKGAPAPLTLEVLERWLGHSPSREAILDHQSFLAAELVELFRRMRVDAIQPFVYLSNNAGPTADWFQGDIKDLDPKPIMKALRNAFAPFGVSLELWDRHFVPGERRNIRVFVFNDGAAAQSGLLHCSVVTDGGRPGFEKDLPVRVYARSFQCIPVEYEFPGQPGSCEVRAGLIREGSNAEAAHSRKIAHVVEPLRVPASLRRKRVALIDSTDEVTGFLDESGIPFVRFGDVPAAGLNMLVVAEGLARGGLYQSNIEGISKALNEGASVVVLEPEFGVEGKQEFPLTTDVRLAVERRIDIDRGGYDSFVFPEDVRHPIWQGIHADHLKFFNGAIGGEIISQHDVLLNRPWTVLARCGLKLGVIAAAEITVGSGRIIISRLQTRGRLLGNSHSSHLFDRRVDPVARQYLVNLLAYAAEATVGSQG